MKRVPAFLLPLIAFAAIAPAAVHHAPPRRAVASHDWTRVVSATPEGGIRMGNPKAKIRLVEYYSYTCPHCAAFTSEAAAPLAAMVRSGSVSYEMRSALRDRLDYLAAMLARCGGPQHFFPMTDAIMADQSDWETRAIAYDSEHPSDLLGAGGGVAGSAIATQSGLDAIAAKQGVGLEALPTCLGDAKTRAVLQATTKDAWGTRKIAGTPGFFINDAYQANVFTWAALEPKLQAALKS